MAVDRPRSGPDPVLFYNTVVLVVVGIVMVFNASLQRPTSSFSFLLRQSAWGIGGFAMMLVVMRLPYKTLIDLAPRFIVLSLILLVAVHVPGIGIRDNGATRWVGFGAFRLQPSEIAKLALILYLAALLSRRDYNVRDLWDGAFAPLCVVGFAAALVESEPDLGTGMVIALTGLTILFLGGARLKHIAGAVGSALVLVALATIRHPYRLERIRAFLDPTHDRTDTTYQVFQGIVAVGSGRWTGLGFGQGRAKFYLPAANTDYIFATVAEELGFLGAVALIALFVLLCIRAFVIARGAPDRFGMLAAAGIGACFTWQALINMLVVTGAAPATGVPLPFVSYGGSSLFVTLVGVGVLLNISQYTAGRERVQRRVGS